MRFQSKSEEELQKENLLPEGDYDFEVVEATEKRSKTSGNDMIELRLKVFDNGDTVTVFDYLLEAMGFKLRHFCEATGLLSKYDRGDISAIDCRGRSGICTIKIKEASKGYPASNAVADYVVKAAHVQRPQEQKPANAGRVAQPAPAGEFPDQLPNDDDVPF